MDDNTLSLVFRACEQARELQTNLANYANQPSSVLPLCESIARAFDEAIRAIKSQSPAPHMATHMLFDIAPGSATGEGSSHGVGEYVQAVDAHHGRGFGDGGNPFFFHVPEEGELGLMELGLDVNVAVAAVTTTTAATEFGAAAGEGSSRRPAGSSGQRASRIRQDGSEYTTRVPAPRTGNTEIPPDDGYTWRKYGQKDILGSRFPRSYYRCTHKNFNGCVAKKQLQRLDDDPYTYKVTYRGSHTCQTSPTPFVIPSLPQPSGDNPQGEPIMSGVAHPQWSMPAPTPLDIWLRTESDGRHWDFHRGEGSSAQAGPSIVQGEREADFPVADMADAMFNSGSSGSSMTGIFPLKDEQWKDKED